MGTSGYFGGLQKMAVGGTSASTPSWGAIISLLNEECLSASGGSKTLGFVNPLFYQNADAFNDITKGSNAIYPNSKSGWKCTEFGMQQQDWELPSSQIFRLLSGRL